jgi:hypothetical protein
LKHLTTFHQWLAIGIAEVILSLFLIAIAPIFLNSDKPLIGFGIWLFVPSLLGSSGIYAIVTIKNAQKARSLFIRHFPSYAYLAIDAFLHISVAKIQKNLNLLKAIDDDRSFDGLEISLIDILKQEK